MRLVHAMAALLAGVAWPQYSMAQLGRPLTRPDLEAWLDGFVPYALQRGDIAGAVVVVVKDGQVLLQKGYGYADVARRTPVDPDRTLFRPGSVGKLFTWTAVMQLVEQGKLDLDRDINQYLDFTIPPRAGRPITLRNVMTHTPGFEEVLKSLMSDKPEILPPLGRYLKSWTPHRIFPPGQVPAYSNYGVALAGYVIERVSGERFEDYIDRHIFRPLGMANSTFSQPLPHRLKPHMSQGYHVGSGPEGVYELVGPAPAGSLAATGADMARFMIAHLQNGSYGSARILSDSTARLMHRTAWEVIPPLHSMLLGFFQRNQNGRRIIAHEGDSHFFHSALSLLLDEDVGFYLSVNSAGKEGVAVPLRTALFEQFLDRYFPAPEDDRSVEPKVAAEHARILAGTYESSRRAQSSFISLVGLASQITVSKTGNGSITVPAIRGLNGQPKQWREVAPFVWRELGGKERLAARVENGKVVMFSVDGVSPVVMFQPAAWWKSSTWLLSFLIGALAALLLTTLAWPIAAAVRRHYGVTLNRTGSEARAYRLTRIAAIAVIIILASWGATLVPIATNIFLFTPALDPWIRTLRVLSLLVFPGAAALALWNARLVWAGKGGRLYKVWSAVLSVACVSVVWVAAVFRLMGLSANY